MLRQQSFHIYGELLFLLLPNAWRISLHAQTGEQLEGHFQNVLKKKFRDCICIIDCSDIFIERPKNLTAHAQTWWNYKHNNTVKYLARVTPTGLVSFFFNWMGWTCIRQADNLAVRILKSWLLVMLFLLIGVLTSMIKLLWQEQFLRYPVLQKESHSHPMWGGYLETTF